MNSVLNVDFYLIKKVLKTFSLMVFLPLNQNMPTMKFGIIKERKNPPDRRVVFTPEELVRLQTEHPEAVVKV